MNKVIDGLYFVDDCGVNLNELKKSCIQISEEINRLQIVDNLDKAYQQECAPITTKFASFYNFFTFPYPEVHNLFKVIQQKFYALEKLHYGKNLNQNYYLMAWLNVYHKNEFVDWHYHNAMQPWTWHGIFCVDTVPSCTSYRYLNSDSIANVESLDNRMIIGLSESYLHRTYPWHDESRPRITIAFEITSEKVLKIKRNICIPF